jgi:chromosome segregation protein
MKLKRLDIHGFKSFYHRTTLAFDEGVTAVVGPNGCGKSNIVDAIKWVTGEQGARALRGQAMEDVVFNGSDQRGPLGMCEVGLTFVNDGSAGVPAKWQDVHEIGVQRRLERGGGSDYLVNKSRMRLADVQELVAGTGVGSGPGGRRAYAIIEQGQIGRLVSAKADERRMLIEEAAGITRFRWRRRDAETRLAEVRLNLERVDDVVGEVESRLRSLARQAKKAERYKAYRAEARQIALRQAAFEYLERSANLRHLESEVRRLEAADVEGARAVEAAEARRAAVRLEEQTSARQAAEAQESLASAERAVRDAEGARALLEQEAAGLDERLQTGAAEVVELEARLTGLGEAAEQAARDRDTLQAEASGHDGELERLQETLDEARGRLEHTRGRLDALRRAASEAAQAISRATAERDTARQRAADFLARAEQGEEELAEAEPGRLETEAALEEAQLRLAEAEADIESAAHRREAAEVTRDEAQALAARAEMDARAAREALAAARSRLASLEELEARREGVAEGGRAVLKRADGRPALGTLAEAFEAPVELEHALAAALGSRLEAVLVEDLAAAGDAVAWLRETSKGVGTFVSAEAAPTPPSARRAPPADDAVVGVLGALLEGTGRRPGLQSALLDSVLVVRDLDAALQLAPAWPGTLVTLQGDRVEPPGIVVGGHGGVDAAHLERQREIRTLREAIGDHVAAAEDAEGQVTEARARAEEARGMVQSAAGAAHDAALSRTAAAKDVHRLEEDLARHARRLQRLSDDIERLKGHAAEADSRAQAATARLEALGVADAHAEEMAALDGEARAAEGARDDALQALHEARVGAAARRERVAAAIERVARLAQQREEAAARKDRVLRDLEAARHRSGDLEARREQVAARLAEATAQAAERATALGDARTAHDEARAAVDASEAAVDARRKTADGARAAVGEARLSVQGEALRLEHLAHDIESRYQIPIGEAVHQFHGGRPPHPEDARRLEELTALIDRMGEINLTAIEEYEEVRQRHDFLQSQRDDLLAAMTDLEKAIDRMNRESRRLFKETFEAVDGHFRVLFPRLFRGGEARLELLDPDNLLETGIEMLVQPPGKKVQNVNLLSGGEKAMCAIALVFAVFRVRPSPFCLLDEVDAPLDDANIGRFNEVVREMSRTSQIILITHNKRTMEIADVLYGITMEEPGVSKLVSVRMA